VLFGIATAALLAAGCGSVGHSEGTGDRAKGKELFTQRCGSCHTLADAGTKGQIGPNLDYAFLASRRDGLGESTIVQVVRGQIAYPILNTSTGAPGMPPNLVVGQDADDVASYVASVAGVGDPNASAPTPTPTPAAPAGGGSAKGDAAAGKAVFTSAGCVTCHTLADAGSKGTVGPNLDDAKPDAALVTMRVTNGQGVMPPFKDQLDATQIADVAAYVSSVAGK
jgi:mono/diheme cytochrome c family protein